MNLMPRAVSAGIAFCLVVAAHGRAEPYAGEVVRPAQRMPEKFEPVVSDEQLPGSPWSRVFTTDEFGRVIVFYVSEGVGKDSEPKRPLMICVQGSGSQSVFTRVQTNDGVRAAASGGQGALSQAAAGRAIVIIVEKPGVRFLERPEQPGSAEQGSREFREQHTLARWSGAVAAAMKAAMTRPDVDTTRILVEGHSEGGLVACKVGADNPEVTHVATLAGGGPTQLFDLVELARRGVMCGSRPRSSEECVLWLLAQWDDVLKNPDSAEEMFFGHPNRRWTTFLATSPIEELKKSRARVFIGQGTEDRATATEGADMLYASLRALGRTVEFSRVPGDHAFMTPGPDGKPDGEGWEQMHARVVEWFLAGE